MSICPAGHRSDTIDFCDVCGLPLANGGPAPAAPPPAVENCPHCGAPRPPAALFCEACGYDYTTGARPTTDLAQALGLARPAADPPDSQAPIDSAGSGPVDQPSLDRSVPTPSAGSFVPGRSSAGSPTPDRSAGPEPGGTGAADQPAAAQSEPSAPAAWLDPVPTDSGPAAPTSFDSTDLAAPPPPTRHPWAELPLTSSPNRPLWVAEVWIDPDWYAAQAPPDPLPAVGLPRVFRLTSPALIGRRSTSRRSAPQIDCGQDSGCSRRQAELTELAGQWHLTDLDSANGTFVAPAGGDLPTQPIGGRRPVGPDDRIYLGAWTRIVVRPALPGEVDPDNLSS